MFLKDGRDLEKILLTAAPLSQHVLSASLCPLLPNIENWRQKLEKAVYVPTGQNYMRRWQ